MVLNISETFLEISLSLILYDA